MKRVTKGTNRGFKAASIMVLIAGVVLCFALSACNKAEEASVETPAVEALDQTAADAPADVTEVPAVQEELPAAATTGGVDAAAPAADAAPAAEAPEAPAN